ncbi:Y-family DNA polymerase [Belnapia rosea]|uniref:Y-family DNA polymerase n=1 Tax=Belnapia rosea TaxID=938405 RepID=UPI0008861811|nr:DNA polymerase Y family protein [Belnapia rosea]SDB20436.1 protein ImuB [Belnapia rosea]
MSPVEAPLVTRAHDGRRLAVAAANRAAQVLGLRPGMPLAHAQAMVPGLEVAAADPEGDADALADLAAWCLRYSPLTAPDAPGGLWIDATGCAHLHGGEEAMLEDLVGRLGRSGVAARAAIADTPGAAWAMVRHARKLVSIVPPAGQADAIALLPVTALRMPSEAVAGLRRLGLDLIGQLVSTPRGPLARRFGAEALRRLDQALGCAPEPITPVVPPEAVQHSLAFPEPLLTAEALRFAIDRLTEAVCAGLERAALGARRLDLLFERVDDATKVLRAGMARPTRDARHLARLLGERLEEVDPGFGVAAMRLVVALAEPLAPTQATTSLGRQNAEVDIAPLVDRLTARFGAGRVFRALPIESDVPERSVWRTSPLADVGRAAWPPGLRRPVRLIAPPQPVQVLSVLPDQPPAAFTWRRVRHRVRRADGPERIAGEWWRRDAERRAVRDYWAVENEEGRRFWLYRRGDGADPATGDLAWFLHGIF